MSDAGIVIRIALSYIGPLALKVILKSRPFSFPYTCAGVIVTVPLSAPDLTLPTLTRGNGSSMATVTFKSLRLPPLFADLALNLSSL